VLGIHHRAWLLCLLSAILQVLIFPLPGFYFLCWIAIAPLLVALMRARRPEALQLELAELRLLPARVGQGFLLGYLSGMIWCGGTCYWIFPTMRQFGGLNAVASGLLLLLFCMTAGLAQGLFGACFAWLASSRGATGRFALALAPALWVAVELARTHFLDFPWNLLGTVQVDNIPLAWIATVTGVYGISFEIVLVNAALATALLLPRGRQARLLVVSLGIAALLQAGRWQPQDAFSADHRAVLVQENVSVMESEPWTVEAFQQSLREFGALSLVSSGGVKPDLIVWPESPAPFITRDPIFREGLSTVAQQTQAWMVVGSTGVDDPMSPAARRDAIFNSAALVNPSGDMVARYDKAHLVPFGEYVPFRQLFSFADALTKEVGTFTPGRSREPLRAGNARLGVFICYESVFPDEVRQFAAHGAQVLVNISNDGWYGDSGAWAQHLQQARMRAVENSRWLLRATDTGMTAAIDPLGRVVAWIPRKTRAGLEAPYALIDGTTFYTRHGGWFAYLCAIISLVALVDAVLIRNPKAP
jgi:apolipoprotein N-acyltransferase